MNRPVTIYMYSRVRVALLVFLSVMLVISLVSCTTGDSRSTYRLSPPSEQEKEAIRQDLVLLKREIDRELKKVKVQASKLGVFAESDIQQARLELRKNRAKVDKMLKDLRKVSQSDWNEIKQNSRITAGEVKSEFYKLTYAINQMMSEE
jgi:hypothetical protein